MGEINKPPIKSSFFEKNNKIEKNLLYRRRNKRYKEKKITRIRNERRDITTVPFTEIKIIIQEYCEELYTNKLDNLDEVEKLLQRHKLPKQTQ